MFALEGSKLNSEDVNKIFLVKLKKHCIQLSSYEDLYVIQKRITMFYRYVNANHLEK